MQLSIRNEREELESSQARRAETEVRKRIGGQEEKMQQLKDQARWIALGLLHQGHYRDMIRYYKL